MTTTENKPETNGNNVMGNERFPVVFPTFDRPEYQKIADYYGYGEVALAIRNAARAGKAIFNKDPNEFIALLNS